MPYGMNRITSTLKFFIGWPLAIIALYFLIKLFLPQFSSIQSRIDNLNVTLLTLSMILFLLYHFSRSYLWKKIMEYKGFKLKFMENAYLWEFSEFKRYVPGNIWSFLSRFALFGNRGVDKKAIGLGLIDEIQLLIISCSLISLFCLPFLFSNSSTQLISTMRIILLLSIIAIVIFSVILSLVYKKRGYKNFISNLFLPGYTLKQKLVLITIAIINFTIFGIANFIVCLSIFSFNPQLYLQLSAFFTFALLVGFLSFITPMGLGVREGIVTLGLSSIISAADAGFLSIFSRIILIITELLFVVIVFMWELSTKFKKHD
jgi:glycosyltransferase 2 family protein